MTWSEELYQEKSSQKKTIMKKKSNAMEMNNK